MTPSCSVREVEIPAALDYLETQMPKAGFIFGEPSIADISITCCFRTVASVRCTVDLTRRPQAAAAARAATAAGMSRVFAGSSRPKAGRATRNLMAATRARAHRTEPRGFGPRCVHCADFGNIHREDGQDGLVRVPHDGVSMDSQ